MKKIELKNAKKVIRKRPGRLRIVFWSFVDSKKISLKFYSAPKLDLNSECQIIWHEVLLSDSCHQKSIESSVDHFKWLIKKNSLSEKKSENLRSILNFFHFWVKFTLFLIFFFFQIRFHFSFFHHLSDWKWVGMAFCEYTYSFKFQKRRKRTKSKAISSS